MISRALLWAWMAASTPEPSLEACDTVRREDPAHWRGYTCVYVYARKTGDYDAALKHTRALVKAEPERTWARYILADLLLDMGMDGAPALYDEVSTEFATQGDFESAALSRVAYAFAFEAPGAAAIAVELDEAVRLAERADDPGLLTQVKLQQARLMLRGGGPLGKVAKMVADARAATFPDGPYEHKKFVLFLEADLEQARDRPERALARLADLEQLAASAGDRYVETTARVRTLSIQAEYAELRRGDLEGLAGQLDSIDRGELESNPHAQAVFTCLQGDLAASQAEARTHYVKCRDAAKDVGAGDSLQSALHGLALMDGDESHLREAEAVARSRGRPGVFSQHLVARVRFRRGDWRGGVQAATETFDLVQRLSARHGDPMVRARWLSALTPYYDEVASWTLGEGPNYARPRVEAALQVVERLRARTIADALEKAQVELPRIASPEHEALDRRIAEVNTRLRDPELPEQDRHTLLRTLDNLEREEAALFDAWTDQYEAETAEPLSLAVLQDALGEDQALISFQVAREPFVTRWEHVPQRSWVAVITRDDFTVHALPDRARVEPVAQLFSRSLHDPGASRALGDGLYRHLFERLVHALPPDIERLTIVPDGYLHRVPFSALGPADGSTLGERFAISRAPSLALWASLRRSDSAPRASALALVDPRVADPSLTPLGSATAEGEALASATTAVVRQGADASEAFFMQAALHEYSVVHFAAHALLDEAHPERAAVVLAPGSPDHDGLLQPRELARLAFDGSLVVLAACRDAAGPIFAEEGPMGLAHALFRGGARTVVASLWPLDDAAASEFFTRFYALLADGSSVADAVAQVRRELRAEGYDASAWAGVIVLGDGDFVPLQPSGVLREQGPKVVGGLVVVLLFGALVRQSRARR